MTATEAVQSLQRSATCHRQDKKASEDTDVASLVAEIA